MKDSIYLDYAAATPVDPRVLRAMLPYYSDNFYNPSSPYAPAIKVRRDFEDAKGAIARTIGGRGNELIMTAGATESINLALKSVSGHVITAAIEHSAVLNAVKQRGGTIIAVNKYGRVEASVVAAAIRPDTELISIGLANNELGAIQPLREVADLIKAERQKRQASGSDKPIWLHSDASQGLGVYGVNVARLGVDLLTINAGKVYGPKQVGALWASSQVDLQPAAPGGGQERGLRSGTENVAGTVGFAEALRIAEAGRKQESDRQRSLRDWLQADLLKQWPKAVVSGDQKRRLVNFLHISFPGIDAERLVFLLEASQVYLATGSACAANMGTRSHVLEAIELAPAVADGSLRITLGRHTTEEQVRQASRLISDAVALETRRAGGG